MVTSLHTRTHEYGSYIMEAMETDVPFKLGGNVPNTGLITNLPQEACGSARLADERCHPTYAGALPEQLAP